MSESEKLPEFIPERLIGERVHFVDGMTGMVESADVVHVQSSLGKCNLVVTGNDCRQRNEVAVPHESQIPDGYLGPHWRLRQGPVVKLPPAGAVQ